MPGFSSITPNINVNTESSQLRTELLNTFSRLDGQLSFAPFRLFTASGPIGNSAGVETTLLSVTLSFNTLQLTGQSLIIHAAGTTAANGNSKTIKLVLGSTTLFTITSTSLNGTDWVIQAEIVCNGATSEITYVAFTAAGLSTSTVLTTPTESLGTDLILKITGNGAGGSDVTGTYWKGILVK